MRFGILIVLGLLISCNSSKQSANEKADTNLELSGNYKVVNLNGTDVANEGMELIFDTASKTLNATTSCNKLFGSYSLSGSQLSFGNMGATKMYCEGRMELEKEMMQGITAVNGVKLQEDGSIGLMNDSQLLMSIRKID